MLPDKFWISSEFRGELKEKIIVKSYERKQRNYFTNLNKLNKNLLGLGPCVQWFSDLHGFVCPNPIWLLQTIM